MEATWLQFSKQKTSKMALLNLITESVKLEESEELFPDQEDERDKMEEGASSEVDIFDTCEEDHREAFVGWKH